MSDNYSILPRCPECGDPMDLSSVVIGEKPHALICYACIDAEEAQLKNAALATKIGSLEKRYRDLEAQIKQAERLALLDEVIQAFEALSQEWAERRVWDSLLTHKQLVTLNTCSRELQETILNLKVQVAQSGRALH